MYCTNNINHQISDYYHKIWNIIHIMGAQSKTLSERKNFCDIIRKISDKLHCYSCRTHMQEYIIYNPPEYAQDHFVWTWEFHNSVNERLNKPTFTFTLAAMKYLGWSL